MKRSVLVLAMAKNQRAGFTLIEVMVSVLIITTVVMALYLLSGNSSHIYQNLIKNNSYNQYLSLLTHNPKYGFENDSIELEKLLEGFRVEDELRRELKEKSVKIIYTEVKRIDTNDFSTKDKPEEIQDEKQAQQNGGIVIEIGKTSMIFEDSSRSVLRLRVL